ncbi:hypothetical protein SD427_01215 [Chryseobacterium sp. JJR-5R]|uniref:hypothetical protein n=1 Tax=Chryseobacterium sp. JJR-5R TaxID=3093923 RepID=UPI002A75064F|nr:hypothetical protein [Chryseobacterium sp. JJR-5R]WPO82990.1 hypothetical protein SD427_01215 [Chryseobacterium sp. JJR-5R]
MKLFQIIAIVFCLGIFLTPKDNSYAQNFEENCCKENSSADCCKDDHQGGSNNQQHKDRKPSSCNKDTCCSVCVLCYSFIEAPFSKSLQLEISYYKSNKNLMDQYADPYLSDRLKEIWQPPKIG